MTDGTITAIKYKRLILRNGRVVDTVASNGGIDTSLRNRIAEKRGMNKEGIWILHYENLRIWERLPGG
jgi:hypothetical protein